MMKNVLDQIGSTPVVELAKLNNTESSIWAKLEAVNPSGSIKDVMAFYMINMAEEKAPMVPIGSIMEGDTFIWRPLL